MKNSISDRRERWQFTSAIGSCAMFLKGTASLRTNDLCTPEISAQLGRATEEVQKLARLIQARFK